MRARNLICTTLGLGLLASSAPAQAGATYTAVVFAALCGTPNAPVCGLQHQAIRDLWLRNTDLEDGGVYNAFSYPNARFEPGKLYIVDTEFVPPTSTWIVPPFTPTRHHPADAHWRVVRAWLEKAAATAGDMVVSGHSFSGLGVVWGVATSRSQILHDKLDTVMTVTSPMAGHPLGVWPACTAYSTAFCSFAPNHRRMRELRAVTEAAITNPNINLGAKMVAVAAETRRADGTYTGSDGLIPTDSMLFLQPNWPQYRGQMPSDPTRAYRAIFYETMDCQDPVCLMHLDANEGRAATAAVDWVDERQVGHWNYCDLEACGPGEGDCDSHAECGFSNGRCISNVGEWFGWSASTDVCQVRSNGAGDYCSREFRCGFGEGNCQSDSECRSGLTCYRNAGLLHGLAWWVDVCQ